MLETTNQIINHANHSPPLPVSINRCWSSINLSTLNPTLRSVPEKIMLGLQLMFFQTYAVHIQPKCPCTSPTAGMVNPSHLFLDGWYPVTFGWWDNPMSRHGHPTNGCMTIATCPMNWFHCLWLTISVMTNRYQHHQLAIFEQQHIN